MIFDHKPDTGADRFANSTDNIVSQFLFLSGELLPGRPERIEFHGPVAAPDHVACALGEVLGGSRASIPAIRVGENPFVTSAADKLIDRLPAGLSDQIPHRDLDATDRRQYGRAALILVANHSADNRFDVEGIPAYDSPLDPLMQNRIDGFF